MATAVPLEYSKAEEAEFTEWTPSARLASTACFEEQRGNAIDRPSAEGSPVEDLPLWETRDRISVALVPSHSVRLQDDIRSAVCAARKLAEFRDDWDGEGSQGYSLRTWRRLRRFVLTQAFVSRSQFRAALPVPSINPADQGSLDAFWRLCDRQLLVNFPADETAPITYYGQNSRGDNTISGRTTGRERRLDLVAWLIQKTK